MPYEIRDDGPKETPYCVYSKESEHHHGCYASREGAEKRRQEMGYFSHQKAAEAMSGAPATKPVDRGFIIVKKGDQFCVYTQGADGKPAGDSHGCHPSEEQARMQQKALYANVPTQAKKGEALMITLGPAVKALGNGKVGGYLVTFGSEATKDAEGEWFTPETDFDQEFPARASVYYHHGMDPAVGRQRLSHGRMSLDAHGVYIEAQLDLAKPNQRQVYGKAERGELGWSSGSLSHVTIPPRELPGGAIIQWPLGHDASLTEIPSDKRNRAVALKSEPLPPIEQPIEDDGVKPSLAENTERWIDSGEQLLGDYRTHAMKAGRKLSAARRARLEQMRQMIDDILSDTEPRDADTPEVSASSPVMGEGAADTGESAFGGVPLPIASSLQLDDLYARAKHSLDTGLSIGRPS